jgi:hypothetical protein
MGLPTLRSTTRLARETLYIGVGAGVLAFQRLQVQRRELEAELSRRFGSTPDLTTEPAEPTAG